MLYASNRGRQVTAAAAGDLQEILRELPWPLHIIDFEASGLGEFTYPIEIGVATWRSPNSPVEIWSSLIAPPDDWIKHRIWNPASEAVHGIAKADLYAGLGPGDALAIANGIFGKWSAYCDGGVYDLRWLRHLAHAAGFPPSFVLADFETLTSYLPEPRVMWLQQRLDVDDAPHRAAPDAGHLMRAVACALEAFPHEGA